MQYSDWSSTGSTAAAPVMVNNRRREFRRIVLRDGLLTPYGTGGGGATRVVVVDVATTGIGMRCRQPLPDGAVFSLSIPSHPDYDNARIRVTRSRPCQGDQYQVGAEFC